MVEQRQSSLILSRLRANRGLTRRHWYAAAVGSTAVADSIDGSGLRDPQSPDLFTSQGPTYHCGPSRKYHFCSLAVWTSRSGKVCTHGRKRSVLEPQLWGCRPLLITQHRIHGRCKALEGMNYLPAPWVPLIRETGPDWGSDINKLDLERRSQRTKDWRNGELWLGKGRGTRYSTSGLVTRPSSGRQCKVTWIWISAGSFLPLEKRASSFFFPHCVARPRPFVPAFPSFVKQALGGVSQKTPPPPPERSAEVVAPTFMRKIPGCEEMRGPVCRSGLQDHQNHWAGVAKNACLITLRLASFRIGAPHDRPTRAPCSCQRPALGGP